MNYEKARAYILERLRAELPGNLYYHCVEHTIDVCNAAERIGISEGIKGEELILLKTAALFHDSGFLTTYFKNEPAGVAIAKSALVAFGYTEQHLTIIEQIIMATQLPQTSKSLLEEVMCDADLDYLGRDDFHPIANALKKEFLEHKVVTSDKHWDEIQIAFLSKHAYFTKTAREQRELKKQQNLAEVQDRYKSNLY